MICGGRCHGGGGGGGDHTRCRGVGLGVPGVEEVDEVPAAADDGHGMPDPSRHLTSWHMKRFIIYAFMVDQSRHMHTDRSNPLVYHL